MWGTDLYSWAAEEDDHVLRQPVNPKGSVLTWYDWFGADAVIGDDVRRVYVEQSTLTEVYTSNFLSQRFWKKHEVSLAPWAGQDVHIVFRLQTSGSDPGPDGWYIDYVAVHHMIFGGGFEDSGTSLWSRTVP